MALAPLKGITLLRGRKGEGRNWEGRGEGLVKL